MAAKKPHKKGSDPFSPRKSFGGEIASAATRLLTRDAVVAELKEEKAFAALAQRYPEEFEKVVDETWARIQRRQTDAEVFLFVRAVTDDAVLLEADAVSIGRDAAYTI